MAKIREDFEGITIVRVGTQDTILKAGDKVPKGAVVGAHLLAEKSAEGSVEPAPTGQEPPRGEADSSTEGAQEPPDGAQGDATGTVPEGAALAVPPKAGPGSGTDAWRAYAVAAVKAKGLNVDISDTATRADIIEALDAAGIPTE